MVIGDKRGSDASIAGRVLEEVTLDHLTAYHTQDQGMIQRFLNSVAFLNMLWLSRSRMRNLESRCTDTIQMKSLDFTSEAVTRNLTAAELYNLIDDNLDILHAVWRDTIHYSAQSGVWNTLLMKILSSNEDWKSSHFSDVSSLLSKCDDVYSAGIATGIESLGLLIQKEAGSEYFLEASPQDALTWITSMERSNEIRESFKESRHFSIL